MNTFLIRNSLLVAAGTTAGAMVLGILAAAAALGFESRARKIVLLAAIASFALPPFLLAGVWLHYLGLAGVWRDWLPLDLYSPGGAMALLALAHWPVPFLMVFGVWSRLDRTLLEVEPSLRGFPLVRHLLLPAAGPALRTAAVIVSVLALNQFTIPALLQVKVLPVEIWIDFNTRFEAWTALALGWPLLAGPILLLLLVRQQSVAWPRVTLSPDGAEWRRRLGLGWSCVFLPAALSLLLLAPGLPLLELVGDSRTWLEFPGALGAGWTAVGHSVLLSTLAALLVVGLGFGTRRIHFHGLDWLPFLVPGVLLGIALIAILDRPWLAALQQGAGVVVLAWTIRYLAPGRLAVRSGLQGADRDLVDAARLEGARGWQLFRLAYWPQVAPQIAAAWFLTYLLCLWDVETLLLIVPPGGETLSLRIFNFLHYGHNAQVNALCLTLLTLAVLPLILWYIARHAAARFLARTVLLPAAAAAALTFTTGCGQSNPQETRVESRLFSGVRIIGTRGAGLGQFNKPRSLAVDAADNLYVVDLTGRVQKFSPSGEYLAYWQMEQTDKGKPKGMCRDASGNIVVVEPHYSRVNHFSPDGRRVAAWGTHGTNAGQLAFPRAAVVTPGGDIYVSEYGITERIQHFSKGGNQLLRVIGRAGTGPGEFNRPEGLGLDAAGNLHVADSCNHRIQIFAPDGRHLRSHGRSGSGPDEFSYPYDVQVDATGREFVCEFGNSRIQVFDADGRWIETIGGTGGAPGRFHNPWGLALDSAGNLYVADSMNHRVQKLIRRPGTHPPSTAATAPGPASDAPRWAGRTAAPDRLQ